MALDFDGFSSWRCLQAHFRVLHFDVFFDSAATRNLDQLWDATWFVPGITAFWVLGCGIVGIVASRLRPRHRPSISLSSLHSFNLDALEELAARAMCCREGRQAPN